MSQKATPKSLLIIGLALLGGATSFLLAALLLPMFAGTSGEPVDPAETIVPLLSMVHAGVAAVALVVSVLLAAKIRASDSFEPQLSLIRWATLEGAAMFGIVIILLAGLDGVLPSHGLYYVNAASYAIMAAVILVDVMTLKDASSE